MREVGKGRGLFYRLFLGIKGKGVGSGLFRIVKGAAEGEKKEIGKEVEKGEEKVKGGGCLLTL